MGRAWEHRNNQVAEERRLYREVPGTYRLGMLKTHETAARNESFLLNKIQDDGFTHLKSSTLSLLLALLFIELL